MFVAYCSAPTAYFKRQRMWNFSRRPLLVRCRPHSSTRAVTSGHRAWRCSCQACATVTTDAKTEHSPKKRTSTANPTHINGPFSTVPVAIFDFLNTYSEIIPIVTSHVSTNSGHPVLGSFVLR